MEKNASHLLECMCAKIFYIIGSLGPKLYSAERKKKMLTIKLAEFQRGHMGHLPVKTEKLSFKIAVTIQYWEGRGGIIAKTLIISRAKISKSALVIKR
jgi:hypothetical protein